MHGRYTGLRAVDGPHDLGEMCTFQCDLGTGADAIDPTVYLVSNNDIPKIQNSEAREVTTNLRTSFDPEPQWLDDATWEEGYMANDVKDGFCLHSYKE